MTPQSQEITRDQQHQTEDFSHGEVLLGFALVLVVILLLLPTATKERRKR